MQDHLLIYLRALKYMNISNSCGKLENSPNMETNTNCTTQGCPEYYLFKKSKSTSPSPPKKEKESAKTKRPVLLDLFDVQSFCMINFFTIIIDMLKGIFVLFDKTVHFKHCSFWLRLKAFCFGKTAERLSATM